MWIDIVFLFSVFPPLIYIAKNTYNWQGFKIYMRNDLKLVWYTIYINTGVEKIDEHLSVHILISFLGGL